MASTNAHAAQIDSNNVVQQVVVIPYCNDDDAEITAYCNGIGLAGTWIDTSYTGSRRGRFAGGGFWFDSVNNEFVAPLWNEETGSWILPPFAD